MQTDKHSFGQLLKQLRTKAGFTQKEMAVKYERSEGLIKAIENGTRPADQDYLIALAAESGYDFHTLLKYRLQQAQQTNNPAIPKEIDIETFLAIKDSQIKPGLKDIIMHGEAMAPTILDNALVTFNPLENKLEVAAIYVFWYEGNHIIRRVQRQEDTIIFSCDNTQYTDISFSVHEFKAVKILGKVCFITHYT